MWPFAKRGARVSTPSPVAASSLDYAVFGRNDACIKIWLPEKLSHALDQLSTTYDVSRPDVLRELLFEHVYGRQELEGLLVWKRRRDAEAQREEKPLFSRRILREPQADYEPTPPRVASIELFGKANEDIKLFLPQRLKDEVVTLATNEQMGLSDYIRKSLVRMLLGEKLHQQWRAAIGDLPADIRRVEAEEEV